MKSRGGGEVESVLDIFAVKIVNQEVFARAQQHNVATTGLPSVSGVFSNPPAPLFRSVHSPLRQ